jgi:hypothetical protein
MWHPYDKSTYESWINAILDEASDELTDWESSFVKSLKNQLKYNSNFSRAQSEKLERIYTRYTK